MGKGEKGGKGQYPYETVLLISDSQYYPLFIHPPLIDESFFASKKEMPN
jgi:hypothetical protein